MRKKVVAGNWKMNLSIGEGIALAEAIEHDIDKSNDTHVILFPPIAMAGAIKHHLERCSLGLQNFYPAQSGAFTGETSLMHAKDLGATYLLIGHSERRMVFGESNELIKMKVDQALIEGFKVVFCVGEPLSEREKGNEVQFVLNQLESGLFHLDANQWSKVILAYEPIWAIGTGVTANSAQAEEMHRQIRQEISKRCGADAAESLSILYGGSCTPQNANELFSCANVDGGLIGGAALNAASFGEIIRQA
jgi:triosephosphate isomerase